MRLYQYAEKAQEPAYQTMLTAVGSGTADRIRNQTVHIVSMREEVAIEGLPPPKHVHDFIYDVDVITTYIPSYRSGNPF